MNIYLNHSTPAYLALILITVAIMFRGPLPWGFSDIIIILGFGVVIFIYLIFFSPIINKKELSLYIIIFLFSAVSFLPYLFGSADINPILRYLYPVAIAGSIFIFISARISGRPDLLARYTKFLSVLVMIIALFTTINHIFFLAGIAPDFEASLVRSTRGGRSQGFIGNPNYYGLTLLLVLPFILLNIRKKNTLKPNWPWIFVFFTVMISLVLTGSRTHTFVAAIVAILAFSWWRRSRSDSGRGKTILHAFFYCALILPFVFYGLAYYFMIEIEELGNVIFAAGSASRLIVAKFYVNEILSMPVRNIYFGYGQGISAQIEGFPVPHLTHMRIFIETGLLGITIFYLFLLYVYKIIYRLPFLLSYPLAIGWIAFTYALIGNDFLWTKEYWLFVALVVAYYMSINKFMNKKDGADPVL